MVYLRATLASAVLIAIPTLAVGQLRFMQPTIDLGELRGGVVHQHRFDFVNDSTNPIEITNVRLGCGCLAPSYDKRVYQPGEKGSLLMHLRTLGQPNGARSWNAHVDYRQAGKRHEAPLILAARIRNEITVEPSIVALTVESTLKQEVTIVDTRAAPFKVTGVFATSPAIRAAALSAKDGVFKIALEVTGSALTATKQEAMLNVYTDDPFYRHLQVPITLTKATRPSVTAAPARVEISGADAQLVRLRASGGQPVRVDKIEAEHLALKCTWASGPGNDATLKIAASMAVDAETQVRVHVGGTVLSIPVTIRKE